MDVQHGAEHRRLGLDEGAGRGGAGVVDEDGDRAACRLGGGDLTFDLGRVGDVGDRASGGVARCHGRLQRCLGAADYGHDGAGAGKRRGNRAADTAAAAGDESMRVGERHRFDLDAPGPRAKSPARKLSTIF